MAGYGIRNYILNYARLSRSLLNGFSLREDGVLVAGEETLHRSCFLARLDGGAADCQWGRLSMKTQFEGDMVLTVRAFSTNEAVFVQSGEVTPIDDFLLNPETPERRKEQLFGLADGMEKSGARDVLLYGQKGRYLWLWFELNGPGKAEISDLRVYVPGDHFYDTFPEVYRNNGEFLHRYLSIFSTLYQELDDQIDRLADLLDADKAPAAMLPVLAGWLGLQLDGDFLEEGELRLLLKSAFPLLSVKGTRRAVEGVVKLFVKEEVYVVERNLLDAAQRESVGDLYGTTPFDFTILVNRRSDEQLRAKLRFLVDQFRPVRSRVNIVFLGDHGGLDAFSYLDVNSAVLEGAPGRLNDGEALTGMTYLQ